MQYFIPLEAVITRWPKGNGYSHQQYSGICSVSNMFSWYKGTQNMPKQMNHQKPEPLIQGSLDPCFCVLYAKFWSSSVAAEIRPGKVFFQSSHVQFWWTCSNCSLSISMKQSDHCSLICGIIFTQKVAAHWIFSHFWAIVHEAWRGLCRKI